MEIVGKIVQVLPEQSGIGRNGNPWKLQAYVMETIENYPRKVHFEVFGEDKIKNNPCGIDQVVTVSFDIESREFNGRWYTSIRAWKIQQGDMTQANAAVAQPAPAPAAPSMPATPATDAASTDVNPFDASAGDDTSALPF